MGKKYSHGDVEDTNNSKVTKLWEYPEGYTYCIFIDMIYSNGECM